MSAWLGVLLDTHLLLWAAGKPNRLSPAARRSIDSTANELLSAQLASGKWRSSADSGRTDFQADPRLLRRGLLDNGYTELPILSDHLVAIESLPPIHKDPFDRLLVAQATVEGITLLTADLIVAKYPGPVRMV